MRYVGPERGGSVFGECEVVVEEHDRGLLSVRRDVCFVAGAPGVHNRLIRDVNELIVLAVVRRRRAVRLEDLVGGWSAARLLGPNLFSGSVSGVAESVSSSVERSSSVWGGSEVADIA